MSDQLQFIEITPASVLADTLEAFLRSLAGPALLKVSGRSRSSCRMIVTLLHGNEPSGVIGCYRFLKEQVIGAGFTPRTDLYIYIAGAELALVEPVFTQRQHSGARDINRCFIQPGGDRPGLIATDILRCINLLQPEAVIDIHNTSGEGPSFSVCREFNCKHLALTALFSHRIVVTDLELGALIDLSSPRTPIVTIECGGRSAGRSHAIAHQGIIRFAGASDIFTTRPDEDFDIYHHPVRLELRSDTGISFSESNDTEGDITLSPNIDKRNFGVVTPDVPLAWVNTPDCLRLKSARGELPLEEFFLVRHGRLYTSHPLKLFMVTTNSRIALSDCLLYAVKEKDHTHLLDQ